ncbi:MAG: hypothetical protein QF921_01795 [Pseudomonadales bacterium]|nr:hypothetical protein [Pseudomonadales bacterium]MDP6970242.1 hypothetical protein [Pseudomonadales bacterium]
MVIFATRACLGRVVAAVLRGQRTHSPVGTTIEYKYSYPDQLGAGRTGNDKQTNELKKMNHSIRLSRISHPRATAWGLALVAVVFLVFGACAGFFAPGVDQASKAATQHIATELSNRVATR